MRSILSYACSERVHVLAYRTLWLLWKYRHRVSVSVIWWRYWNFEICIALLWFARYFLLSFGAPKCNRNACIYQHELSSCACKAASFFLSDRKRWNFCLLYEQMEPICYWSALTYYWNGLWKQKNISSERLFNMLKSLFFFIVLNENDKKDKIIITCNLNRI